MITQLYPPPPHHTSYTSYYYSSAVFYFFGYITLPLAAHALSQARGILKVEGEPEELGILCITCMH